MEPYCYKSKINFFHVLHLIILTDVLIGFFYNIFYDNIIYLFKCVRNEESENR